MHGQLQMFQTGVSAHTKMFQMQNTNFKLQIKVFKTSKRGVGKHRK